MFKRKKYSFATIFSKWAKISAFSVVSILFQPVKMYSIIFLDYNLNLWTFWTFLELFERFELVHMIISDKTYLLGLNASDNSDKKRVIF